MFRLQPLTFSMRETLTIIESLTPQSTTNGTTKLFELLQLLYGFIEFMVHSRSLEASQKNLENLIQLHVLPAKLSPDL